MIWCNICLPIFAKRSHKKGCKMSGYVRSSKAREYAKEANYIYKLWKHSKFNFFFCVMGIFDWPITNKFNQALEIPKIHIYLLL
jgi:hypothetical protein